MSDEHAQTPQWFREALAAPVETGEVDVDGAAIRFRAWGAAGQPGLVLVHGGRRIRGGGTISARSSRAIAASSHWTSVGTVTATP